MSSTINTIDIYLPSISFLIYQSDGTDLSANYQLTWTGRTAVSNGTKAFNSVNAGDYGKAYFVPVNTKIKFVPNFNDLPSNNSIIQHKWTFGDGNNIFVTSPLANGNDGAVYHIYNSGLAPTVGNSCLTATLTAIDKYQRHVRVYKQIYLKQPS